MSSFIRSNRFAFRPWLVACAVWAAPAAAAAQQAAVERAAVSQSDYRKAHEAARSHNWSEARRILLGLWAQAKTYDVAASLSEVEYALGHAAASAQYVDYALRHVTPNESAATLANMKSALEKLRPKVGAVKLTLDQPNVTVSVDGAVIDYEPESEVFVEPGAHVFEARSGERTTSKSIDVAAGSSQRLALELPQATTEPAALFSASSTAPSDLRHGESHARTVALWVGGALAVGGLGTGIGFGLASNAAERDADDYRARVGPRGCPNGATSESCAALQDSVNSQRSKTRIANIGYGVAGVGLVTVGVALLWPRSHPPASARASRLELSFSGDRLWLGGNF